MKISEEIGRIMTNVVTVRKMERGRLMVLFGTRQSKGNEGNFDVGKGG